MAFLFVLALWWFDGHAVGSLDRAYAELRQRNFDAAVSAFRDALRQGLERSNVHKDLAYTLLKVGETEAAREHFRQAMELDPGDEHTALEYAFLCYETKEQATARRVFNRLRKKGNAAAERAFRNIDEELETGIARWTRAVELSPGSWSAHAELARLAERRDELALAAEHYERAWRLRPEARSFLLDLGRVRKLAGDGVRSHAALLAASRGAEPRVAETARELLPARYPYVYEFHQALELDPGNTPLRRELAYLHLEMGQKNDAEAEFRKVVEAEPRDALSAAQLGFLLLARRETERAMPLLQRALEGSDDALADRVRSALGMPRLLRKRAEVPRSRTSSEAREMAQRSLDAGYLKDALKYLKIAHENDPLDFGVMLKLGWTHNILREDRTAVKWFDLARRAPDAKLAAEASQAHRNLAPSFAKARTSAYFFPVYSSRWRDVFTYAQIKTELMPRWSVRPYLSTRFSGDTRRTMPEARTGLPQQLSESAGIFALGLATKTWRGVAAWGEAGSAISYLKGGIRPDYRGGVTGSRSFGRNFGADKAGLFAEAHGDAVFISRFENDTLLYAQTRGGYTAGSLQFCWNLHATSDTKGLSWARTVETGPGVRIRVRRPGFLLSVDALRGRYTVADPLRAPRYTDLRVGVWYAFVR